MSKYYRVVKDFLGEEHVFIPKNTYEYVDYENGRLKFLGSISDIKEVCFSKEIPTCFFAIAPLLILNKTYYIYETDIIPCMDLCEIEEGDFKATKEVRYRIPVQAKYIGKFITHEDFYESITELYKECCVGDNYFDTKNALYILENYYHTIYDEIEFFNK